MINRKFKPLDPEEAIKELEENADYIAETKPKEQHSEFQEISETDAFDISDLHQFSRYAHTGEHEDQHYHEDHAAAASPDNLLDIQPKQPKPEVQKIYTESPRSSGSKLSLWAVIVTVAIILCGAIFVYFLNDGGSGANAISGTAIIKADPVQWKVRPSDPGGKTMPFEDLTILNPSKNNEILQQHVDQLLSVPMIPEGGQSQEQPVINDVLEGGNIIEDENSTDIGAPSEPSEQILDLEDVLNQN